MKTLRNIMSLIAIFAITGMNAQKINKQVTKEEMVKTYTVDHGDKTIDYSIKINTKETGFVTMEKSDLSKKEQDRVPNPVNVTKVISIDNDADPMYDNVLALTYTTKSNEEFSLSPTTSGFLINIDGNELHYDFINKDYKVVKKDADTFDVVVMKTK